jgi:hypothetical protein
MALRLTLSVMIAPIYAQISAGSEAQSAAVAALVKAYPDFMDRIEGKQLSANRGSKSSKRARIGGIAVDIAGAHAEINRRAAACSRCGDTLPPLCAGKL